MMEQNFGANPTKWSRNLSEENDANRMRLLTRQRQLLENKLQRQHQIVATSTRSPLGRPIKSDERSPSANKLREKLIDFETSQNDYIGIDNPGLSINQRKDSIDDGLKDDLKDDDFISKNELSSSNSSPELIIETKVKDKTDKKSTIKDSNVMNDSKFDLRYETGQITDSDLDSPNKKLSLILSPDRSNLINESNLNPLNSVLTTKELLSFVTQPISPQITLQCSIIRDKKGIDRSLYPTYYMHLQAIIPNSELEKIEKPIQPSSPTTINSGENEQQQQQIQQSIISNSTKANYKNVFLLSGRRRKKSKTYLISNEPYDISRKNCIAKVKSNVLGTQFTAFRIIRDGQQREEIVTVIYDTNVLGFKGPRKMTVLVPNIDKSFSQSMSLFEDWKNNSNKGRVLQLKNKTPIWNDETQSYVLNFHGRVTQASVKNFQLIVVNSQSATTSTSTTTTTTEETKDNNDQQQQPINTENLVSMQFGRVSNSQFTCDVSWPMSLLQAFAIALSSFDNKLACE